MKFHLVLGVLMLHSQIWQVSCLFKMTKLVCKDVDPNFVKTEHCYLKPLRRNVAAMYFQAKLFHVAESCKVNLSWNFKKSNAFQNSLLNQTGDACDFMKNREKYPVLDIVYSLFEPYTNINHTCPYEGTVKIDGFVLNHEILKLPLPSAEFVLNMKWFMNGALRFDVNVWFSHEEMKNGRRTYEILQ